MNVNLTPEQQDIIQFSKAVQRVEAKRQDFGNFIAHGHRDRIVKETKEDPLTSWCNLEIALEQANARPDTKEALEANTTFVSSVLYIWYKVPEDL